MKVVLSTIGKFHSFNLARQLYQRGYLERIFTGYPRFKLRHEDLPDALITSRPWFTLLGNAHGRVGWGGKRVGQGIARQAQKSLDAYTADHLPPCDVFVGLSGSALKTGIQAQKQGALYVCDRGSSHIRYQNRILEAEYLCHRVRFRGTHPGTIAQEEAEYAAADVITVPSHFAARSFEEMGVPVSKMRVVPYGVDLSRFYPVGVPDPEWFDILFVGGVTFRKGIPDLLKAYAALRHPKKRLTLVGTIAMDVAPLIRAAAMRDPIRCRGHRSNVLLKEDMSLSHVLVLPSVEDGFGLVMAEAMACGCPVIATNHTGAEDLLKDGREGFVVSVHAPKEIAARLQEIADDPALRQRLSAASLARTQTIGGWDSYGAHMISLLTEIMQRHDRQDAEGTRR